MSEWNKASIIALCKDRPWALERAICHLWVLGMGESVGCGLINLEDPLKMEDYKSFQRMITWIRSWVPGKQRKLTGPWRERAHDMVQKYHAPLVERANFVANAKSQLAAAMIGIRRSLQQHSEDDSDEEFSALLDRYLELD